VLLKIEELGVQKIIFLGDFMNNGIAKVLASNSIPVFEIWGNNDGDKVAITKTALSEKSNLEVGFDVFDIVDFDQRKIFLTHYPLLAKPMAKSGEFDAVFFGHNHVKHQERIGDCLVLNPGEVSAHKTGECSFAMYDTKTNNAEIIVLENSVSVKTSEADKYIKDNTSFSFSKTKSHKYE
jgi:putative phosphoesterase